MRADRMLQPNIFTTRIREMRKRAFAIGLLIAVSASACGRKSTARLANNPEADYTWTKVSDHAAFPEGYNFPLFNVRNQLWVLRSEGNWFSDDGKSWTKAELPALGLRTAYQQYVQFKDSILRLRFLDEGGGCSGVESGFSFGGTGR